MKGLVLLWRGVGEALFHRAEYDKWICFEVAYRYEEKRGLYTPNRIAR